MWERFEIEDWAWENIYHTVPSAFFWFRIHGIFFTRSLLLRKSIHFEAIFWLVCNELLSFHSFEVLALGKCNNIALFTLGLIEFANKINCLMSFSLMVMVSTCLPQHLPWISFEIATCSLCRDRYWKYALLWKKSLFHRFVSTEKNPSLLHINSDKWKVKGGISGF